MLSPRLSNFREAVRIIPQKRRLLMVFMIFLVVYIGFYLATTKAQRQGMGGMSGPVRVRVFNNESHLVVFYPLYLVERWCRNGSFVYAQYHFNVDFKDKHYDHSWLYGDGKYDHIWYDMRGMDWWRTDEGKSPKLPPVVVSDGVPAFFLHAALQVVVHDPSHGTTGGTRTMESPVGYGSDSNGCFDEQRLVAIKENGFDLVFTRVDNQTTQAVLIHFPFGETTETSALGCKIVGTYK